MRKIILPKTSGSIKKSEIEAAVKYAKEHREDDSVAYKKFRLTKKRAFRLISPK